jgi:dsRNA-specific ribonuclease
VGEPGNWLLLVYKVPAEPARARAMIWRRLKALGAVYLQDGLAKLKRWLEKVQARDVLDAGQGPQTAEAVARCEAALESFAAAVCDADAPR